MHIPNFENYTDTFVNNVYNLANAQFDKEVYEHFRYCFLDYVGCTFAGSRFLSLKVNEIINTGIFPKGESHIIGNPTKLNISGAAFINAICSHVIELDDGHKLGAFHPAAPIFSGLLAVAEYERISYGDFIRGAIVGYEAALRLASAIQPYHRNRGFHTTGTCGAIGVAMAVSAALHFNKKEIKSALAAAVSCSSGVNEMMNGNSQLKPFNAGKAAYDGVMTAYIGKVNFLPPDDVIGGKRGFFAVMTDKFDDSYIRYFDTSSLLGMTNYFKLYAACRHCHAAIEATLKICKENLIIPKDIEKINIGMYESGISGHEHQFVDSVNSAKMSIPYCVAVSIIDKNAGIGEFDKTHIDREDIKTLSHKVFIYEEPSLTALIPQKRGSIVEIITKSSTYVKRVDSSKGDKENPMTSKELISKFYELVQYSGVEINETKRACDAILNSKPDISIPELLQEICQSQIN